MRLALGFVAAAVGLLAAACGSVPSDGGDDGGTDDAAVGLDGTLIDVDALGLDGPDLVPPTPTLPVHRLFPLDLGWHWTWQVTYEAGIINLGTDCSDGVYQQDTRGVAVGPDGIVGTQIDAFCSDAGDVQIYTYNSQGVDYSYDGLWHPLLYGPLENGAEWTIDGDLVATWNGPNPINVAAGTYDDCWTAVVYQASVGYTTRQVYCPEVGNVYIELTDAGGTNLLVAQITAATRDP